MEQLLKKAFFSIAAIAAFLIFGSCDKIDKTEKTVSVYLTYTITTDNGQQMSGTKATSSEVFDEFYQKIKSGELVASQYNLVFTEKTTGSVYTIDGTWAGKDMITLRTGTYKVVGQSTATGENIQDKCSLKFEDDVTIDVSSTTITLKASYDCSLIIFSDASISKLSNFNGVNSTELFKLNNFIYAFVHTNLYSEGKQDQAYLEGRHTNNTQFKIYTGHLNYEIGKFYVYNDINADFDIEKMEEGGAEGYPVDLSYYGTANCYIVASSGAYKYRATVKGNSTESVGAPVKAEVLWETYGTTEKPKIGDIVNNISYNDGYIYFSTPSNLANGNALIAVKDVLGNILWSWHIWVCKDFDPVKTAQVYYNNAGIMMDRNLGATSATPGDVHAFGLNYQWGRKDPFMGISMFNYSESKCALATIDWPNYINDAKSIEWTVQNPMINIYGWDWYDKSTVDEATRWSATKTIYDPCPYGWRVSSGGQTGVWYVANGGPSINYKFDNTNYGINLKNIFSDQNVWYPATCAYDGAIENNHNESGINYWSCTDYAGGYDHWAHNFYFAFDGTRSETDGKYNKGQSVPVRCQRINQ